MKCFAVSTRRMAEKFNSKKTHFLSNKELENSDVVEFNFSDYPALVKNTDMIEKFIQTSPFKTNISVLIIKDEERAFSDDILKYKKILSNENFLRIAEFVDIARLLKNSQIQVNNLDNKNYIQVDFFKKSKALPDITFICNVQRNYPEPIKIISTTYSAADTKKITEELSAILQCTTFFCTKFKRDEDHSFVIKPIPAFALSYWKG